jgi:hypothetical protein
VGAGFWWSRNLHGGTIPRMRTSQAASYLRFPVISHGAEFLVQGYLMRRNILTYKAHPTTKATISFASTPIP